jgi:hypothetical protein
MTQISRKRISTWSTCTVCNKVRFIEGLVCPTSPHGTTEPVGLFSDLSSLGGFAPTISDIICVYTGFSANLRTFPSRERPQ